LKSQIDVLDHFRQHLYVEEQQRQDRKQATAAPASLGMIQVTINNYFPQNSRPVGLPI
jgi:hypothetical protein